MFQKKIIDKYLLELDQENLESKYEKFKSIFANETKQENIRNSKEEQYQEGFIRDLFCAVFGYTIKPEENYNILTELKNESSTNSKKSDGAIVLDGKVKAVIELKGTDTQDLDKVAFQAFSYKNHHENCNYVIVSNFERLRLYVETQIEYEEFKLFHLSKERFNLLYLLLSLESVKDDIPLKLKRETVSEEKEITNRFYADYSAFKRELFSDLCDRNQQNDQLSSRSSFLNPKLLFLKKTQKLLDRILFILFCEDRGLLPVNSALGIIADYKKLKEMGYYQPLYDVLKTFFNRIDKGFKNESDSSKDVFAYNGGLFKTDEILDSVKIDDDVLLSNIEKLAQYDFESQISVDILGRIFENSLTEMEDVRSEELDARSEELGNRNERGKARSSLLNPISKRKKDGVFYTPEYITKYIVENTIGTLCAQKRAELKITDDEFSFGKKYTKKEIEEKDRRLSDYRTFLLNLKILDPACGSGAFLNAALNKLKEEHALVDRYFAAIHKSTLNFESVDNDTSILENNLYGVDINEDSIEITKLSLWLATAKKNRKLTTLTGKIKVGNSLIDDAKVAGEKAFDWAKEFPEVFFRSEELDARSEELGNRSEEGEDREKLAPHSSLLSPKGGFDVVIGNPPYVNINTQPEIYDYLKNNYAEIHTGYNDLMYYFLYKGIKLLKPNGLLGMITSNYFLGNEYAKKLRLFLNKHAEKIINFHNALIFSDANVHTSILFAKNGTEKSELEIYTNKNEKSIKEINLKNFDKCVLERKKLTDTWLIANSNANAIIEKMKQNSVKLEDITIIEKGSTSGKNDIFTVSKEFAQEHNFESELIRKNVKNGDIQAYSIYDRGNVLIYTNNQTQIENYPNIYKYLLEHKDELSKRNEVAQGRYPWYRFERPRNKAIFDAKEKLVVPYRAEHNRFAYDNEQYFNDGGDIRAIVSKDETQYPIKVLLAILNSKLLDWYYGFIGKTKGKMREYFNNPLAEIPIPNSSLLTPNSSILISLSDKMLSLHSERQTKSEKFLHRISETYGAKKSAILEDFCNHTFAEIDKEFARQKIHLSLKQKDELEDYFNSYKSELSSINNQISETDRKIDAEVYKLYGLSAEEIAVVEKTT